MPVTRGQLVMLYEKRANHLQVEIQRHEALDTSIFPFDQMQLYKKTLSKLKADLEITMEVLKILKRGD